MTELTDELKAAFIAAAGWQAEPWRLNAEVADGLVAVLAAAQAARPKPPECGAAGPSGCIFADADPINDQAGRS